MSSRNRFTDSYRRPELFLSSLIRSWAMGEIPSTTEAPAVFQRALVIAIDVKGGQLENPTGSGGVDHILSNGQKLHVRAQKGPENPRNSIKARILSDGYDRFSSDADLRVFWPFFPEHIAVPIKISEHVYIMFEDAEKMHGLWIAKIPGHQGLNYAPGEKTYARKDDNTLAGKFPDSAAASDNEATTDKEVGGRLISDGNLADKFST